MSGLTLRIIINDEKYVPQYNDLIEDIKKQMEKTHDTYYINEVFPVNIDTELTVDLLNNALNAYNLHLTQLIKTHVPFTEKQKRSSNLCTIKEIVLKNEIEKTDCCCSFISGNKDNVEHTNDLEKGAGSGYMCYDIMDEPNKKMMDVWATKGVDGMVQAIVDEMKEKKMSYAEMRARYG